MARALRVEFAETERQGQVLGFGVGNVVNNPTWPASPGTADTTTWAYDPASGVLLGKTDAANRTVSYAYNTRFLPTARTWARGVTTTYAWDNQTAELLIIGYPTGTTNLTSQYNRLGQLKQVDDPTGTRYLDYCACGKLSQETLPAYFGSRVLAYKLDQSTSGALGRTRGYTLTSGGTVEQDITYGFDAYGRQSSVVTTPTGFAASTFNYAYQPNSDLLSSIAETAGSGWSQTRSYFSNRNLLDVIETKVGAASKAKFDYEVDTLGRRTTVAKSGELYARYQNGGLTTNWSYNDRSEVTSEQSVLAGTSTALAARNLAYAFDHLGNRTSASADGSSHAYTTNSLNQYTQTTRYPGLNVTGLAPAAAAVTVNGANAATRQGDYYAHWIGLGSAGTSAWQGIAVNSTYGGGSTRSAWLAASPQAYAYDLDGNLLSDDRWDYAYDAENRLLAMQTRAAVLGFMPNVDARRVEFTYDWQGRQVRKRELAGYNGAAYTSVVSDVKFLYDGMNVIAEIDGATGNRVRSYTWGPDWSGSRQGAGGVGGLLQTASYTTNARYLPAYDGNGNMMGAINQASGALDAAFEYDAFGQTLRATGPAVGECLFRFSTKYTDLATGLVQYGWRFYVPQLGRFLNRDPIEERGGLNLYAFVGNNGVNQWDYLGLKKVLVCRDDWSLCWIEDWPEDTRTNDDGTIVLPTFVVNPDPILVLPTFVVEDDNPSFDPIKDYTLGRLNFDIGPINTGSLLRDSLIVNGGDVTTAPKKAAPKKSGKQTQLDLLKKLCGTEAGRALVDALRNGSRSVREVSSDLLSPGLQTATSMTAGTSNEAAGTIYLFPANYANLANTLAGSRFNYRGSAADFGASTLIHENLHFNNPAPPGAVPAGQAGRYEEALVRQLTDKALPSYGLPQIFGLSSFEEYRDSIPKQGTDLATGKPTGDYGQRANSSIMSQLDAASSELSGWDCSRVGK